MTDYISLLNDKDAEYIGTLIGGKNIRHFFQNNPSEFAKIRPGFRPNAISDTDAIELASRFRCRVFISAWLTKWINNWLDEIHSSQADLIQKGSEEQEALILTMANSLFAENIDLYFKLTCSEYTPGHIQAIKFAVKKIREKPNPGTASTDKDSQIEAAKDQSIKAERQWKAAEEAYQQKIKSMNTLVDASRQELINAKEKITGAQSEISSLRSELAKYHKLSVHTVNCGELFREEQYQYTEPLPVKRTMK